MNVCPVFIDKDIQIVQNGQDHLWQRPILYEIPKFILDTNGLHLVKYTPRPNI